MACDGDIGRGSIDGVVSVGVNSVVGTLDQVLAYHLGGLLQLEICRCNG